MAEIFEEKANKIVPNEENVKQLSDFFINNGYTFTKEEIFLQEEKLKNSKETPIIDEIKSLFKGEMTLKDLGEQANKLNIVQNNLDKLKAMHRANANLECCALKKELTPLPVEDKKKLEK